MPFSHTRQPLFFRRVRIEAIGDHMAQGATARWRGHPALVIRPVIKHKHVLHAGAHKLRPEGGVRWVWKVRVAIGLRAKRQGEAVREALVLALRARVKTPAENALFSLEYSYVCPEPVLVSSSCKYKMAQKRRFPHHSNSRMVGISACRFSNASTSASCSVSVVPCWNLKHTRWRRTQPVGGWEGL
jgi:hypothetical protein